jgi:hypothetical protein
VQSRAVERGGEAVIFTGAQTSKRGPRKRNLPFFESYFKILPGPRVKSTILSTALVQSVATRDAASKNCVVLGAAKKCSFKIIIMHYLLIFWIPFFIIIMDCP